MTASSQVTQGANLSQPVTFTFPQYLYNFASSLTSETLPSGRVISTTYDSANRPATLQGVLRSITNYIGNPSVTYSPGDVTNSIQYVPHGAVYAYTRGDGITRAESYNLRLQSAQSYYSRGNVNSPSAMLFVSCPHWGFGYGTDVYAICPAGPSLADNGNLVAYDEYLGAPGASSYAHFSQPSAAGGTITYDGVNRLTGIDDSGGWSRNFAYDQWGNMSVVPGSTGAIGPNTPQASDPSTLYNANNQRKDSGQGYDATGNVNQMYNFSNITYDAENRLLTANASSPFSYEYDGDGRRVTKTGNNNTTIYVYDAAGELAAEYSTAAPDTGCQTCYLSYDHLGSTRMVTNESGQVVERHDYLPFGEEIIAGYSGRGTLWGMTTGVVDQKFSGKERDAESGLDYFGARYYGSALGRWTSPDWSERPEAVPYGILDDPQSLNLYDHLRNNPLSKADPDGHWPWCVGAGVGALIGGGLEAYHEYKAGKGFDGWKIAGKAAQGALNGAVAVATGGSSLLVQGSALAVTNAAGGALTRAIEGDPNSHAGDSTAIAKDVIAGAAGGVVGGAVGNFLKGEAGAAQTSLQVEGAQADRQALQGIISGDSAQVAAGQAARASVDAQSTAINLTVKYVPSAARAGAKVAATKAVEHVLEKKQP